VLNTVHDDEGAFVDVACVVVVVVDEFVGVVGALLFGETNDISHDNVEPLPFA
jgi:hypothetical protein